MKLSTRRISDPIKKGGFGGFRPCEGVHKKAECADFAEFNIPIVDGGPNEYLSVDKLHGSGW